MKMLLREMIANCSTKVLRRDVAGFNGDKTQAEMINANGGNSHTTTFCYTPKSVKIAIPIFDGTNPRLWIKKCGRCFSLCNIQEKQKVEIASRCMIGKANEWMSDYLSSWKSASWTDVILSLLDKFHDKMGPDTEERELKKWADSLQEYISECELDVVKDDIVVVEHVEKYVEDEGVMDKEYVQEDVKCDNLDVYLELEGKSSELLPEIPEVQLPIDIFKKGAEPVEKFLGEAEIDKEDVQDDVVIENLDESSVLNGSLLVVFVMDGQVKPLPWRDKIEVYNHDYVGLGLLESDPDGSFITAEFDTNCNRNLGYMNKNLVGVNLSTVWGLEIAGIVNQKEGFHPYNVSDYSVVGKPPIIPVSSSGDKHHKRLDWGLGISGSSLFCAASVPRVAALSATRRPSEEAIDGTGIVIEGVSGCCTKMEDKLGELDASENGWTANPPPWRDKNDVVCWKPRGRDKNSVQSVAGAYGKVTLARMMRHYNGFGKNDAARIMAATSVIRYGKRFEDKSCG